MTKKSPSPTVRALDELENIHKNQCNAIKQKEFSANDLEIGRIRKEHQRETIRKVNAAIRELDVPFRLVEKDICNVSQYDHSLRFDMVFDPSKDEKATELAKANSNILALRKKALNKLQKWYTDGLYLIASREPVPKFRID
jgi:hypothetical protein